MKKIKVSVYDDNSSRREGLKMLLDAMEEIECVGTYPDCREVVSTVQNANPDVILMDIDMPYVDGIEGVKQITNAALDVKVIMQTVFEDENKILAAICAGADGYILKEKSPLQLIDGISDVMNGGAPMTPVVARKVLKIFSQSKLIPKSSTITLTKRETEILGLLVEGYSYKMIAERCCISYATVNTHISHIYEKLQVNSVAGAVSKAIKEGLV